MTVLEVIQRGTEFLAGKGVESPRLQTELLLAHALNVPRLNLYLQFERDVAGEPLDRVRELLKRRGRREPLQHLMGSASFCGLEFKVGPQVMIPRPETELLAEKAWHWLSGAGARPLTVLDFGTGSGCLAVTLAVMCPGVVCHAIDVSLEALDVARENAVRHGVAERVLIHSGDGFAALPADASFDLIVSNPPYIPSGEIEALPPEVRDHDPHLALDGGPDGLRFYGRLAAEGPARLHHSGRLLVELGDGQAEAVSEIFARHKWIVERVEADYSGQPRVLAARLANNRTDS